MEEEIKSRLRKSHWRGREARKAWRHGSHGKGKLQGAAYSATDLCIIE